MTDIQPVGRYCDGIVDVMVQNKVRGVQPREVQGS